MSVRLNWRKNKDGSQTPFLTIYTNRKRTYEFLPELKKSPLPAKDYKLDEDDRKEVLALRKQIADNNAENARQAELIRAKRSNDLILGVTETKAPAVRNTKATVFMDGYMTKYNEKDRRNMQGAINHFKKYLDSINEKDILMAELTQEHIAGYKNWLIDKLTFSGPVSYFARFKKLIRYAIDKDYVSSNILYSPSKKKWPKSKVRVILSIEEISKLKDTPIINDDIRRAFLLTCSIGLRFCDVKALRWKDVNSYAKTITVYQIKTGDAVTFSVNDYHLDLLGTPQKENQLVFDLPSANGCNKTLQYWVDRAGIKKKVTWHCGRHSCGTNLLRSGVDISIVQKVLGHQSIEHTLKYVQIAEDLIRNSLDKITLP